MARIVASDAEYFTHLKNDVANTLCELLYTSNSVTLSVGKVLQKLLDFCLAPTPTNDLPIDTIVDNNKKTTTCTYIGYFDKEKIQKNLWHLDLIISVIANKIVNPINLFTAKECEDFLIYFTKGCHVISIDTDEFNEATGKFVKELVYCDRHEGHYQEPKLAIVKKILQLYNSSQSFIDKTSVENLNYILKIFSK